MLIPGVDRMVRVSLRTVTLAIPPQDVITRDNVTARVDAVAYFRVVDPNSSVVDVEDAVRATLADRADDAALRARQGRPRRAAERARAAQRGPPADHRRADRAVGDQGDDGRDQGRQHPGRDAARDVAPGRGRARAAREGHPRRGRVPGRREAGGGGRGDQPRSRPRCSCATCRRCRRSAARTRSTIVFPLPIDLIKPLLEGAQAAVVSAPEHANGELPEAPRGELPQAQ